MLNRLGVTYEAIVRKLRENRDLPYVCSLVHHALESIREGKENNLIQALYSAGYNISKHGRLLFSVNQGTEVVAPCDRGKNSAYQPVVRLEVYSIFGGETVEHCIPVSFLKRLRDEHYRNLVMVRTASTLFQADVTRQLRATV